MFFVVKYKRKEATLFSKENHVGKPKGCFPTFVNGIPSKPVSVDYCAKPKGIQIGHLIA